MTKSLMKSQIIEQLGQSDLLLPSLIAEGLAANDRIKVRMSALQAAARHARDPGRPVIDLGAECHAASLDASAVMSLVAGAHLTTGGRIAAPELAKLAAGMLEDARTMIHAVEAGDPSAGEAAAGRLAAIKDAAAPKAGNEIAAADIARLTGLSEAGGDSLHRLVMDLHKVLNRLASACAQEIVAGAHVYGLAPGDRPVIEAFMRGVDETRGLKFDHPGLGTTATRAGPRLVIQNDIGATDAHVVVVAVEGNVVTRAKVYVEANTKVTFKDVAGVEQAKFELQEVVSLLQNPKSYGRLGARVPKGILVRCTCRCGIYIVPLGDPFEKKRVPASRSF
jgi:hypothetical protein